MLKQDVEGQITKTLVSPSEPLQCRSVQADPERNKTIFIIICFLGSLSLQASLT